MSIEPYESVKLDMSSKDRSMLDNVISKSAAHKRFEITSLKINRAMTDVTVISKLLRREALEDAAVFNPIINSIGAATSRIIIPST